MYLRLIFVLFAHHSATARGRLGMPEEGLADLERVLNLDPANKTAQVEMQKLRRQIAVAAKREKAAFSGFFNKVGARTIGTDRLSGRLDN